MTEQEIQEFGQALAERFKQVGDEMVSTALKYMDARNDKSIKRLDLLVLELQKDKAFSIFETWSEVTDLLPLEIKRVFVEHLEKIKKTEDQL
ncbi:hypothetical protein [Paenibacillus apii]|uniref:hypothetical protein n=1 Tax=Paenibacillus apii TaxID=1850370 RepID=UPI001439177B|nr:hypothetical protein [Paenibacillus apii]NJJ37867.1 hypothetical protein [Paenibacillus apii]